MVDGPMTYSENRRFEDEATLSADYPITTTRIKNILMNALKQMFMSGDFMSHFMRYRNPKLLYTDSEETTRIRIVRDVDWRPENMSQMPTLVISSQGTLWKQISPGPAMEISTVTPEAAMLVGQLIVGRFTVWCLSTVGDEAETMADEVAMFFGAMSKPLIREYGLTALQPMGPGAIARIAERKGYFGCPMPMGITWQVTQRIMQQAPRLAEVRAGQDEPFDDQGV